MDYLRTTGLNARANLNVCWAWSDITRFAMGNARSPTQTMQRIVQFLHQRDKRHQWGYDWHNGFPIGKQYTCTLLHLYGHMRYV